MLKGTKLYSIFTGKCPVCHEGKMYVESNPYKLNKIYEMHERCSVCNTKYKIEPSFFYGAMYISYGIGVAFAVAAFITSYFFIGLEVVPSFISIIVVLVLLGPIIMRLARNIWINMFLSYDEDAKHKTSKT
ncbi:DUF983 domain-containing protein [Psychroflexus montanilacus]|uniref:DUF983 domain-containing protein n=1 Tax=Psychroflexus montanilacus TaxID=2873598 RepID=UPI001CCBF1BE|nr:DUF983 domain-containing protein [Psychroflexus montanilacus]MBZ9651453.1 DUF983 domain-containing protein [Psychroflexus montanilacus]